MNKRAQFKDKLIEAIRKIIEEHVPNLNEIIAKKAREIENIRNKPSREQELLLKIEEQERIFRGIQPEK